jgi:phosphonopyruvate decarboxylase
MLSQLQLELLFVKKKKIFCFDGDGSSLMHLGAQANSSKLKNIVHILFNNYAHDSVGGQKPPSENITFNKLAKKMGYGFTYRVNNLKLLKNIIKKSLKNKKSTFIEILCEAGHRKELTRPGKPPLFYKKQFMKFLKN